MSDTATQLLATFESLPAREQHELLIAMLRRSGELPDTIVSDDQLAVIADELFRTLDAEDAARIHSCPPVTRRTTIVDSGAETPIGTSLACPSCEAQDRSPLWHS